MAAGLLAVSGVGAPAAAASGPDEEIEGSVEVVDEAALDSLDLGEETTSLPDAVALVPDDEDVPVAVEHVDAAVETDAVVEAEVVGEVTEPVPDAGGEELAPAPDPSVAPEPAAPVVPPAEAPPVSTPEGGGLVGPVEDENGQTTREREREAEPRPKRSRESAPAAGQRVVAPPKTAAATATATATAEVPAPVSVPVVAGTSTTSATSTTTTTSTTGTATSADSVRTRTGTSTEKASPGDRVHVVQRGESLWSIANDLIGERATVARVAREVNRLWGLNEDRIVSGDPDLVFAGTRLRLR